MIKESYISLKNRLGRVPLLYDFYENQEIDPLVIIREYKTYYAFMQAMEKDGYKNSLSEQENIYQKLFFQGYVPMNLQYLANSFKVNRLNLQILRKSIEEHLDLKSVHHR